MRKIDLSKTHLGVRKVPDGVPSFGVLFYMFLIVFLIFLLGA